MVYDCFTFYNELELLEIRLNILDSVVDKFVLLESPRTYTNLKKPLYYNENKKLFRKFQKKIIHVIVKDSPNVSHPWIIEHFLMAATKRGLVDAKPNDTILISNLDEIPNPKKIVEYKEKPGKLKVFEQIFFYYYLNFASINKKWYGTKMLKYKYFIKYLDAYVIRHSPNDVTIENGGWHFSYMGGVKRIKDKMATGSHQEYNNDKFNTKEKIIQAILQKKDFMDHGDKFDLISEQVLPDFIVANKKQYNNMFFDDHKTVIPTDLKIKYLTGKHTLRIFYRTLRKYYSKF